MNISSNLISTSVLDGFERRTYYVKATFPPGHVIEFEAVHEESFGWDAEIGFKREMVLGDSLEDLVVNVKAALGWD